MLFIFGFLSVRLIVFPGLSGVLASLFRISTYVMLYQTPTIYFFLCVGQVFICLIIFHISVRSGFVQHHLQRHQHNILTNNSNSLIKSSHSLSYQINTPNSSLSSSNINNMLVINNDLVFTTVSMEMNNPVSIADKIEMQNFGSANIIKFGFWKFLEWIISFVKIIHRKITQTEFLMLRRLILI